MIFDLPPQPPHLPTASLLGEVSTRHRALTRGKESHGRVGTLAVNRLKPAPQGCHRECWESLERLAKGNRWRRLALARVHWERTRQPAGCPSVDERRYRRHRSLARRHRREPQGTGEPAGGSRSRARSWALGPPRCGVEPAVGELERLAVGLSPALRGRD